MDAMDVILSRRSIRKYTKQLIPDQTIKELLKAAMSAPCAGNKQSWHFIVINNHQILDEIPKFHPYSQMVKEASVGIVVCGDLQLEDREGVLVQNCSAATENILIAVQSKGLGAVWLCFYPIEERIRGIRNLLGLPEHIIPITLVPIGYPAEQKPRANRYNETKIHYNRW
ncbi:MAG: nitroreductase family protein [Candidatus Heimdallarchaeota archaeon]